jgi:hypothetical protein
MSDPGASFGAAHGGNADNPMIDCIAAACNAWTVGLSALQAIARQSAAAASARPGQETAADPLSLFIGISSGLATALSDILARRPEWPPAGAPGPSGPAGEADLASLMAQALMVGAASALRYWRGLVGIYGKHEPALMQRLARPAMTQSSTPETEDPLLVDALRALLREIGTVAVQEARRLETELEQIGEAVAHGLDEPGAAGAYRRRWKVKD